MLYSKAKMSAWLIYVTLKWLGKCEGPGLMMNRASGSVTQRSNILIVSISDNWVFLTDGVDTCKLLRNHGG